MSKSLGARGQTPSDGAGAAAQVVPRVENDDDVEHESKKEGEVPMQTLREESDTRTVQPAMWPIKSAIS